MSFDGAKVRRFFGLRKRLRQIVCEHSLFVDAGQIIGRYMIFLEFSLQSSMFFGENAYLCPPNYYNIYNKVYGREKKQVHVGGLPALQHR